MTRVEHVGATLVADNLAVVLRHLERINRRDVQRAVDAYAPDVLFHGLSREPLDREGTCHVLLEFMSGFPDAQLRVEDIIADENRVVVRHAFHGTHRAPYGGIPATGRLIKFDGVAVYRLANERIVEGWLGQGCPTLLEQLR